MNIERNATYAFLLIPFLHAVGMFLPETRVWGVNILAYLPQAWGYAFLITAVVFWLAVQISRRRTARAETDPPAPDGNTRFYFISAGIIILLGVLYTILSSRTHFLGDGYQNLAILAENDPFVKNTEVGESLIHLGLKHFTGNGESGALLSFQIISIASGVLALIATTLFAVRYRSRLADRLFILLGIASGGYALLFFGYVEYYSLFVMSVIIHCLMGIMILEKRLPRWTIIPSVLLSVFLHILGVTLIPGAVYLLCSGARIGHFFGRLNRKTIWMLLIPGAVLFSAIIRAVYIDSYFFRFAIVPLLADRFTVEGYILFSIPHLLDLLNLLVLLVPSLPLLVFVGWRLRKKKLFSRRRFMFLAVAVLSSAGAVFLFDPKLGMARDWDLFSFAAVPVTILGIMLVLELRTTQQSGFAVPALIVGLGFLTLFPRALVLTDQQASLEQVIGYFAIDVRRSGNYINVVEEFCKRVGDTATAARIVRFWHENYPEKQLNMQGSRLLDLRRIDEALGRFDQAIAVNPAFAAAYYNRGLAFIEKRMFQRAVDELGIANGLNPNGPLMLANLGYAYLPLKDLDQAEMYSLKAYQLDPEMLLPLMTLSRLYKAKGDQRNYRKFLNKGATHPEAPPALTAELAIEVYRQGNLPIAGRLLWRAVENGLDSTQAAAILSKKPQLTEHFRK